MLEILKLWQLILINILYHKNSAILFCLLRLVQTMLKNKIYNIPENIQVYLFKLDDIIKNKLSRFDRKKTIIHYKIQFQ